MTMATLIFTCGGETLCETLAGEDVGVDEAEETPASVVHNFTRGRTTLGQVSWDMGDWGPLVKEVFFSEFSSKLDVLGSSFTSCSFLDSSFSPAARACWRVDEVNSVGCGGSGVEVSHSLVHALFNSLGFTCSLAFERSEVSDKFKFKILLLIKTINHKHIKQVPNWLTSPSRR